MKVNTGNSISPWKCSEVHIFRENNKNQLIDYRLKSRSGCCLLSMKFEMGVAALMLTFSVYFHDISLEIKMFFKSCLPFLPTIDSIKANERRNVSVQCWKHILLIKHCFQGSHSIDIDGELRVSLFVFQSINYYYNCLRCCSSVELPCWQWNVCYIAASAKWSRKVYDWWCMRVMQRINKQLCRRQ